MKRCPNCKEEVEDNFELCWNCYYSFTENMVIKMPEKSGKVRDLSCLRCNVGMMYSGNYNFHEGERMGLWGNLFEAFVNRESFDIYICPRCGKVEFFTPRDDQ